MSAAHLYRAYGLIIQSPIPLPELLAGGGAPDVVIHFGTVEYRPTDANRRLSEMQLVGEDIYLFWGDIGSFVVRGGREIIIDPLPGVQEHVLRLFILGTTLAMLLCQRGLTVFHASAVAIRGQVVAFAGVKGAGKSTSAAALHAAGHTVVADDILAIDTCDGVPMVLPGFPHLKLWPDSVALLGHDPEQLPRLRPEVEKRSYSLVQRFSAEPLPLRHFCLLSPGPALDLQPYEQREALGALMPHWYGTRFGMERLRALGLADFFQQCVSVARSVSVYRLERPRSSPVLEDIRRLLEEKLLVDARDVSAARNDANG
jgi:hypothetical protein